MNLLELSEMELGRRRHSSDDESQDNNFVPKKIWIPVMIPLVVAIQLGVSEFESKWTWLSLCYDPYRRHEVWRYFAILLIHFSRIHLVGNILFELILGLPLEMLHGGLRTGAIFIAGIIGGSLCISILQPKYYAVGASAGVYAFFAAHLVTFLINWHQMRRKVLRFIALLTYIIFDVTIAIYRPVPNVSHAAHFGGAIGGFIASVFIVGNLDVLKWEKPFKIIVGCLGVILILSVVIINISFSRLYLHTEFNFNYVNTFLKNKNSTLELELLMDYIG